MSMVALGPIPGEICSHCPFVMWNYTSRGNLITVLVLESSHPDSRLHKYGRILYLSTMYYKTSWAQLARRRARAARRPARPAAASRCD